MRYTQLHRGFCIIRVYESRVRSRAMFFFCQGHASVSKTSKQIM